MGLPTKCFDPRVLAHHNKWRECTACALQRHRRRLLEGVGNPDAVAMFVLDRLSPEEAMNGSFLVDSVYETILEQFGEYCGRDMSQYWYSPLVACPTSRPVWGDRVPEMLQLPKNAEIAACASRLHEEIKLVEPEIVILFGTAAIRALFPTSPPQLQYHTGEMREAMVPGESTEYPVPVLLCPSLHQLYVEQDFESGGLWNTTFSRLATALDIAHAVRTGVPKA